MLLTCMQQYYVWMFACVPYACMHLAVPELTFSLYEPGKGPM